MITSNTTYYRMGPLLFQINGTSNIANCVRSEFRTVEISTPEAMNIVFNFNEASRLRTPQQIAAIEKDSEFTYAANHSGLRYAVKSNDKSCSNLTIEVSPSLRSRTLRDVVIGQRFMNWNYLTSPEVLAKNFVYDLFDYITQSVLISKDATYIHSSAIEKDGVGVLIAGAGGVGKSSFMLKSILEDGWSYLADDLAIVDKNAFIWRTPKKMQIYGYNTMNEPRLLKTLLSGRSILDIFAWHVWLRLRGPKRVRRRVSAERLFGRDTLLDHAKLEIGIFLKRSGSDSITTSSISPSDFSLRSSDIIVDEIAPFSTISKNEHATSGSPILPTVDAMRSKSNEIMNAALENCTIFLVDVPYSTSPKDLRSAIIPLITT